MNLLSISRKFNTENKCYAYLEKLRWGKKPVCPYCGSKNIVRLKAEEHRLHCYDCHKSFSVTVGTVFEDSRLPMTKWFMIVGLITNAKQGISAKEIERDLDISYKTAWYCSMRVRCAMIDYCNIKLANVVEMDEAYLGGRPRFRQKCSVKDKTIAASGIQTSQPKRGRGTCKTPIVAIVERHGKVVVKVIEKVNSLMLMNMLKQYVNIDDATLMTDDYRAYNSMDDLLYHFTINHSEKKYAMGAVHTNTVEGFFALVKNSIRGNYIKVSKKYLPFYLLSNQYMYNHRKYLGDLFVKYLKDAMKIDKSDYLNNYKPIKETKKLIYGKCEK